VTGPSLSLIKHSDTKTDNKPDHRLEKTTSLRQMGAGGGGGGGGGGVGCVGGGGGGGGGGWGFGGSQKSDQKEETRWEGFSNKMLLLDNPAKKISTFMGKELGGQSGASASRNPRTRSPTRKARGHRLRYPWAVKQQTARIFHWGSRPKVERAEKAHFRKRGSGECRKGL